MSSYPNGPQKFLTSQELDAWLLAAQEQQAKLHIQAARPHNSPERYEAFAAMSALLQEAFEEVRMMSESLRKGSQVVRSEAANLRAPSIQLMERGVALMERMAQFASPSPAVL